MLSQTRNNDKGFPKENIDVLNRTLHCKSDHKWTWQKRRIHKNGGVYRLHTHNTQFVCVVVPALFNPGQQLEQQHESTSKGRTELRAAMSDASVLPLIAV